MKHFLTRRVALVLVASLLWESQQTWASVSTFRQLDSIESDQACVASFNRQNPTVTNGAFQEQALAPAASVARFFQPYCRLALVWTLVLVAAGLPQRSLATDFPSIPTSSATRLEEAMKVMRMPDDEKKVDLLRELVSRDPNTAAQTGAWEGLSQLEAAKDPDLGLKRFYRLLDYKQITPDKYTYPIVSTLVDYHHMRGKLREGAYVLRNYLKSPSAQADRRLFLDDLRMRLFQTYMQLGDYQAALDAAPNDGLKAPLEAYLRLPESQRLKFEDPCPGIFGCNGDFRGKISSQTPIPVWILVNPDPSKEIVTVTGKKISRRMEKRNAKFYESLIKDLSVALDYLNGDQPLSLELQEVRYTTLHSPHGSFESISDPNMVDIMTSAEVRFRMGKGLIYLLGYRDIAKGEYLGHGVISIDASDLEMKSYKSKWVHETNHGFDMWHDPRPFAFYVDNKTWFIDRGETLTFDKTVDPYLGVAPINRKRSRGVSPPPVPMGRYTTFEEDIARFEWKLAKQLKREPKRVSNSAAPFGPSWAAFELLNLRFREGTQRRLATAS